MGLPYQRWQAVPYVGMGDVLFNTAISGIGTIPNLGTGDMQFASALTSNGNLRFVGIGGVTFTVELSGVSALSDTSLPYKHFEAFSNIETYLDMT